MYTIIDVEKNSTSIATRTRANLTAMLAEEAQKVSAMSADTDYVLRGSDEPELNNVRDSLTRYVYRTAENVRSRLNTGTKAGEIRAAYTENISNVINIANTLFTLMKYVLNKPTSYINANSSAQRSAKLLEVLTNEAKRTLFQSGTNLSKQLQMSLYGIYWGLLRDSGNSVHEIVQNTTCLRIMGKTKETLTKTDLTEARRLGNSIVSLFQPTLSNNSGDVVTQYLKAWEKFLPKAPRTQKQLSTFFVDYELERGININVLNEVISPDLHWIHKLLLEIPIGRIFSKDGQVYFTGFISLKDKLTLNVKCVKFGSLLAQLHGNNDNAQLVELAKAELIDPTSLEFDISFVPNDISFAPYYKKFGKGGVGSCMTHSDAVFSDFGDNHVSVYSSRYWGYIDNDLALVYAENKGRLVGRGIMNTRTKALVRWYGDPAAKNFLESTFGIVINSYTCMHGVKLPFFIRPVRGESRLFSSILPYIDCSGSGTPCTGEDNKLYLQIYCNRSEDVSFHKTGGFGTARYDDFNGVVTPEMVKSLNFTHEDWDYPSNMSIFNRMRIEAIQGISVPVYNPNYLTPQQAIAC